MNSDKARRIVERIARESYGRPVAFLVARTRDVASAKDMLAEAFAGALEQWPTRGLRSSGQEIATNEQPESGWRSQTAPIVFFRS
jgi:DNA-directed RNA polymerase specialized sigma24 family protein